MSSIPSPLSFLESVTGYNQDVIKGDLGSAAMPIRLAVIDPAYVASSYPTTLPRVTFEGEDTVTDKRYPVISRSYIPGPSDRVVMIPIGHTHVIVGVLEPATTIPVFGEAWGDNTDRTTTSTSYTTLTGAPSVSISVRAGQYVEVVYGGHENMDSTGANGAVTNFQVTGASGTQGNDDTYGLETGDLEWTPVQGTTIWGPATTSGSHTFTIRSKLIGPGIAHFKRQHILARALNG